jgi:hypothetical protein
VNQLHRITADRFDQAPLSETDPVNPAYPVLLSKNPFSGSTDLTAL